MAFIDPILPWLTFLTAIGSGLIAGVFFAFSAFVMRALARLPAGSGMAAMQSINVVVLHPVFLGVFMGTALLCAAAMVGGIVRWERTGMGYVIAGGAFYLIGTFLVTILFNVPLNDSLAAVTAATPDGAEQWASYVSRWTMWNHVRMVSAIVAMIMLILAFRRLSLAEN